MSETLFNVQGLVKVAATVEEGLVKPTPGQSLKVNIEGFRYDIGGKRGAYAGAIAQTVTDDDTSYVYLDENATLQINTTGFPTGIHLPLSRVICADGEVIQTPEERVVFQPSSSSIGTCIISLPVDGDIRGGDTSATSNNDWAAIRYDGSGSDTDARNRLVRRTPRNYVDGDLVARLVCSVTSSISGSNKSYWLLNYKFASLSESLGSMANVTINPDHDGQSGDELFSIDLTIPEVSVDMSKEYMAFKLMRDWDHANDTYAGNIYVHNVELRYNGRMLAGQAGQ
jgi:hypothetical protein